VAIDVGALVLAPVLGGMVEGAETVTPIAAQIWMEIDPNAFKSHQHRIATWRNVKLNRETYSGYHLENRSSLFGDRG
jgi:hypothetical protein